MYKKASHAEQLAVVEYQPGVTLSRQETVNIVYTLDNTVQPIKGFNSAFLCVSLPS